MNKLPYNTEVTFNLPHTEELFTGRIVGVANIGVPVIGISYIVSCPEVQNETYEYPYFVIAELFLDLVPKTS